MSNRGRTQTSTEEDGEVSTVVGSFWKLSQFMVLWTGSTSTLCFFPLGILTGLNVGSLTKICHLVPLPWVSLGPFGVFNSSTQTLRPLCFRRSQGSYTCLSSCHLSRRVSFLKSLDVSQGDILSRLKISRVSYVFFDGLRFFLCGFSCLPCYRL